MKPAVYDTMTVDIETLAAQSPEKLPYLFRATGSTLRFAGFLKVYGVDEDAEVAREPKVKAVEDDETGPENASLPDLQAGDPLNLHQLLPKQHFTQPPPRYTEAMLIGELKKRGLGRPSTYAAIIETIKSRHYVDVERKRLFPTALGFQVCELLEKLVSSVVDVGFTAEMEADLDAVARGEQSRLAMLRTFYEPFQQTIDQALVGARSQQQTAVRPAGAARTGRRPGKGGRKGRAAKKLPTSERAGQPCPQCGQGEMVVRSGKFGPFLGCTRYQEGCSYTEKMADSGPTASRRGKRKTTRRR
jgi:DNA topoisomerase-1